MSDSQKPIILIVDDEADMRKLFYQPHIDSIAPGATVLVASNAADALDIIRERKPDILLLDVTIPETEYSMNVHAGEEYEHSARVAAAAVGANPNSKTILVSSYAEQHVGQYPEGTSMMDPFAVRTELSGRLQEILGAGLDVSAPAPLAEVQERPDRHVSRIDQIRRSPWHDGSREAMEESWAIQVGKLGEDPKGPRR